MSSRSSLSALSWRDQAIDAQGLGSFWPEGDWRNDLDRGFDNAPGSGNTAVILFFANGADTFNGVLQMDAVGKDAAQYAETDGKEATGCGQNDAAEGTEAGDAVNLLIMSTVELPASGAIMRRS
ncbi:hypothetical protein NliqN6_1990 [Naganishia liquefaciens]|uniref:Uncharacterized protein n=1 Tax=Naganishia liquefaciens TaxID=104408 RepID=A0A8H3TR27_9TREE|nr:hypothetical protein NliqN6_1990 [Naganishia liquefaciens]